MLEASWRPAFGDWAAPSLASLVEAISLAEKGPGVGFVCPPSMVGGSTVALDGGLAVVWAKPSFDWSKLFPGLDNVPLLVRREFLELLSLGISEHGLFILDAIVH